MIRPRLFSIEEANALLPELDSRLGRIEHKRKNCASLQDEILMHELLVQTERQAGIFEESAPLESTLLALENLLLELEREIKEILAIGCCVRSLERGWIDFPGARGEERVYYCWRRGETSVQFFHGAESKTTERYPL